MSLVDGVSIGFLLPYHVIPAYLCLLFIICISGCRKQKKQHLWCNVIGLDYSCTVSA